MQHKNNSREFLDPELVEHVLERVRAEFTVMPRFGFHQPLDYNELTLPPDYEAAPVDPASGLPIPSPRYRFNYSPQDAQHYLSWGRYDHDELVGVLKKYGRYGERLSILDLGCSSGRVLRHFQTEWKERGWRLYGCDIQALAIQWLRHFFPAHFIVATTSTLPHLPYEDNTFDFIYGISVFTHIKYLWDSWLLELRRVLKPGGLMVQTIHAERAWEFYHAHRDQQWVRESQHSYVYENKHMEVEFLSFGDAAVSQVFWRREIARMYWSRYFKILEARDPPRFSFQDWMVCRKE